MPSTRSPPSSRLLEGICKSEPCAQRVFFARLSLSSFASTCRLGKGHRAGWSEIFQTCSWWAWRGKHVESGGNNKSLIDGTVCTNTIFSYERKKKENFSHRFYSKHMKKQKEQSAQPPNNKLLLRIDQFFSIFSHWTARQATQKNAILKYEEKW